MYRGGEAFDSLFAIRAGSFKTFITAGGTREQVTGFHLPGETIGLDGIAHHHHTGGAVALEDAQVCALPFAGLSEMAREAGALHLHLHHIMSREIVREHGVVLLLGSMRAEQRMAALLINLSERLHARGLSPVDLVLRMSRGEIGSYLGMKLETVSRTLARLVDEGAIDINLRQLRILDMGALRRHLYLPGTLDVAASASA